MLREGDFRGQYELHYYTDKSAKKLKGKIALDECDGVSRLDVPPPGTST